VIQGLKDPKDLLDPKGPRVIHIVVQELKVQQGHKEIQETLDLGLLVKALQEIKETKALKEVKETKVQQAIQVL
jgi:hypothetical protein